MIKDNQRTLNKLHVVLDALFTVVAYSLAWLIMISGLIMPQKEGVVPPQYYFAALIFIVPERAP